MDFVSIRLSGQQVVQNAHRGQFRRRTRMPVKLPGFPDRNTAHLSFLGVLPVASDTLQQHYGVSSRIRMSRKRISFG